MKRAGSSDVSPVELVYRRLHDILLKSNHRPQSSSFLNMNPKKELLWGLWAGWLLILKFKIAVCARLKRWTFLGVQVEFWMQVSGLGKDWYRRHGALGFGCRV